MTKPPFPVWCIVLALPTDPCPWVSTVALIASSVNMVLNCTCIIYPMFHIMNLYLLSRNQSRFITGWKMWLHAVCAFSIAFIKHAPHPTYPYKAGYFMNKVTPKDVPNTERASLLRFWMTPSRPRTCTCDSTTSNLAKHLTFECNQTRDSMALFLRELPPKLRASISSSTFPIFLKRIAGSPELLESFNRVACKFDVPRY